MAERDNIGGGREREEDWIERPGEEEEEECVGGGGGGDRRNTGLAVFVSPQQMRHSQRQLNKQTKQSKPYTHLPTPASPPLPSSL